MATTLDPALDPSLDPATLTDEDWAQLLTAEAYRILRTSGTERGFTGPYLEEERPGNYHCGGCGQELYGAAHKFHSGCGWPSFFQEVKQGAITIHEDATHGMSRTEMRCGRCAGHLGHVFRDAPNQPTGLRHCVNGQALVFVPVGGDLKQEIGRTRR